METFITSNPGITLYLVTVATTFLLWRTLTNSEIAEEVLLGVLGVGGLLGFAVKATAAVKLQASPAEEGSLLIVVSVAVLSIIASPFVPDFSQ